MTDRTDKTTSVPSPARKDAEQPTHEPVQPGGDVDHATPRLGEAGNSLGVHDEPTAETAGEEDHGDPDRYRGDPADPPTDTGKPGTP